MYRASIADKEAFWAEQAAEINWFNQPTSILSKDENLFYRWFDGGELNTSYLCLDHHIEQGRGEQTALIYDSPVTGTVEKYSFIELRDQVARCAGGLQKLGVGFGDTVVIYMPMIPQAVIAMIACARIGAIHSVVFGGFAPHELALRIEDAEPKVIITASYGIEVDRRIDYKPLAEAAIAESTHKPEHLVIFQREGNTDTFNEGFDVDLADLIETSDPADAVPVPSWHPLYILYTSGTTGKPKGIIRDNGGHAVAMKFSMRYIYDQQPGDVFWAASDVGWVVGHSYIVYGPLINGSTTVLYEGKPIKTPDAGAFWRVISEHKVKTMFTAPTAVRAIRKEDPNGELLKKYDISCLQQLFLAGERCDPSTFFWIKETLERPIVDHWWQTESGWAMLGVMTALDDRQSRSGSAGFPICGYDIQILSEEGDPLGAGRDGYVALKLPLPPGCLPSLWKTPVRFYKSYLEQFEGYYLSGDGGYFDEDGYFFIMGRVDDVINVAGHRLSTGEMEEIVAAHVAVAECAVVGIADEYRGQRPIALAVLKDGFEIDEVTLENELVAAIREKIGAIAFFKSVAVVRQLPKTRSGKILRKTIRNIADGVEFSIPSTIDDPGSLDLIAEKLKERMIGASFEQ